MLLPKWRLRIRRQISSCGKTSLEPSGRRLAKTSAEGPLLREPNHPQKGYHLHTTRVSVVLKHHRAPHRTVSLLPLPNLTNHVSAVPHTHTHTYIDTRVNIQSPAAGSKTDIWVEFPFPTFCGLSGGVVAMVRCKNRTPTHTHTHAARMCAYVHGRRTAEMVFYCGRA
uniref:Uncharacterized protein n=1 Tax=Anopheles maculatus TaxID=74869 RepID=A0A182T0D4_9DIPT